MTHEPQVPQAPSAFLGPNAPAAIGQTHRDVRERRNLLYELMGDLPDRYYPITAKLVSEEERDGYVLEKLELDLNGIEPVPAYVAKPKDMGKGRVPAVVYNHAHGGRYDIGKEELTAGRTALQDPPYAKVITDMGWMAICVDTWVFGERAHTSELDMFKAMLWQGRVMWGMMVYDTLRATDYLLSRPEVDPERIVSMGISMGSTMAWWHAALDERVKVTVDLCCLTEFHTLLQGNGLGGHGIYYYVPSLLKHFTTSDINALIAPRAHLGLAGIQDTLTPPDGLDIIDRELKEVYAAQGVPENWRLVRYDDVHRETPEGRQEIVGFLKEKV
jgi:Abhydrolase family